MRVWAVGLLGIMWQGAALAQSPLQAHYDVYAAGLNVASVDAGLSIGRASYQMNLAYRTTGMAGVFFRGHQDNTVTGAWHGMQPAPSRFFGKGVWRGNERVTDIEYVQGRPVIRQLEPPNEREREPVPEPLQAGTIDTMSALTDLMHVVAATGRCELTVRTYDGRRAVEIEARTVGEETLEATQRSAFSGKALRCDFAGRLLAGFKFGDDHAQESRPMHGTAWLATVVAGGPPVPVRMSFETRWFGDATMHLTSVTPVANLKVARGE